MTIENKIEMGFRLPNIDELKSLLWAVGDSDCEAAFRSVFNGDYITLWSSTPGAGEIGSAWRVSFCIGSSGSYNRGGSWSVRLVRDDQSVCTWEEGDDPSKRYEISECGQFVTDNATGLEWMRDLESGAFTWDEAIEAFGAADDVNKKKQIEIPVDKLVSDVFQKYGYDNSKVIVTTCASVVRVERPSIANCYLQKEAAEPDSLWKVYVDGNYVCGMETLHDGFRVPQLIKELTSALENKIA